MKIRESLWARFFLKAIRECLCARNFWKKSIAKVYTGFLFYKHAYKHHEAQPGQNFVTLLQM